VHAVDRVRHGDAGHVGDRDETAARRGDARDRGIQLPYAGRTLVAVDHQQPGQHDVRARCQRVDPVDQGGQPGGRVPGVVPLHVVVGAQIEQHDVRVGGRHPLLGVGVDLVDPPARVPLVLGVRAAAVALRSDEVHVEPGGGQRAVQHGPVAGGVAAALAPGERVTQRQDAQRLRCRRRGLLRRRGLVGHGRRGRAAQQHTRGQGRDAQPAPSTSSSHGGPRSAAAAPG
jgi:hypothetical protein